MVILWIILAVLVVLLAVVLVRTLAFRSKEGAAVQEGEETFDRDRAVDNLRRLVQCKTVSYKDASLEDDAEFEKLINLLPTLYPNVFATCSPQRLEDRGLLFCWKGRAHDHPSVMMAHYDVVPVDEASWEKPPFEAVIEDGVMWGRGTLDTKVTLNAVLSAANAGDARQTARQEASTIVVILFICINATHIYAGYAEAPEIFCHY